jgi:hypothetical protein
VGDDAGAGQLPVVEELGEVPRVSRQAEVLALALVRLPEAEMVDDEDRAGTGEGLERSLRVRPPEGFFAVGFLAVVFFAAAGASASVAWVSVDQPACTRPHRCSTASS